MRLPELGGSFGTSVEEGISSALSVLRGSEALRILAISVSNAAKSGSEPSFEARPAFDTLPSGEGGVELSDVDSTAFFASSVSQPAGLNSNRFHSSVTELDRRISKMCIVSGIVESCVGFDWVGILYIGSSRR